MEQEIKNPETEMDIKSLYDEVLRLSEQINSVKEKVEKEFPIFDSLRKIKEEITELKKNTTKIEEYKSYADKISNQIDELKQNDEKETQIKWPLRLSIGVGLSFLIFSIIIVWMLFFTTPWICVKTNDSIPMLITGVLVYFIMAIILVYFACQSRHIFNYNGKNNAKK